ncbi:hypothetical protein Tco_0517669 [Tanacetum coccineum]
MGESRSQDDILNRIEGNRKWLLKALDEGPYELRIYLNMILLSILMRFNFCGGCLHFGQGYVEMREALVCVYNCFAQLMNDLEQNNMNFPTITSNTKFLNSLQLEWLKYVTQVRLAKRSTVDSFDDLFDYLQQFEKLVNTSRAKKLEKSHDPLALVAHTGLSSRQTSSYYVTHPTSMVDYDDEYQHDDVHNNYEDPLVFAMLLLEKSITQNFSIQQIYNRLCASIQHQNSCNHSRRQMTLRTPSSGLLQMFSATTAVEKGNYARELSKAKGFVTKSYFMEHMLLQNRIELAKLLTDEAE